MEAANRLAAPNRRASLPGCAGTRDLMLMDDSLDCAGSAGRFLIFLKDLNKFFDLCFSNIALSMPAAITAPGAACPAAVQWRLLVRRQTVDRLLLGQQLPD
ncbi:hypothetical protein D3C78_1451710 [compost metagenome]